MKMSKKCKKLTLIQIVSIISLFSLCFWFTLIIHSYAKSSCINTIVITGQSLATGAFGIPALTTKQPYDNIMLKNNQLVPLVENNQETISSSMANTITSLESNHNDQLEVILHGWDGAYYKLIKKGTSTFNQNVQDILVSKQLGDEMHKHFQVTAISILHGESDDWFGWGNVYESNLKQWQNDYETLIKKITHQTTSIPILIYQLSSYSEWSSIPVVSLAQLSAAEHNPNNIILVSPMYFFTYRNGPHLTNKSYRWLGEYYGKVYKQVVIDHKHWMPLYPESINRLGNIIHVHFHVPSGQLVFDTKNVLKANNYGFEFYQIGGNNVNITVIKIINSSTVEIVLNSVPTGVNQQLRYAYTAKKGAHPGAFIPGSSKGNLRDSDNTPSLDKQPLYNWCVTFDKQIHNSDSLISKILYMLHLQIF